MKRTAPAGTLIPSPVLAEEPRVTCDRSRGSGLEMGLALSTRTTPSLSITLAAVVHAGFASVMEKGPATEDDQE